MTTTLNKSRWALRPTNKLWQSHFSQHASSHSKFKAKPQLPVGWCWQHLFYSFITQYRSLAHLGHLFYDWHIWQPVDYSIKINSDSTTVKMTWLTVVKCWTAWWWWSVFIVETWQQVCQWSVLWHSALPSHKISDYMLFQVGQQNLWDNSSKYLKGLCHSVCRLMICAVFMQHWQVLWFMINII